MCHAQKRRSFAAALLMVIAIATPSPSAAEMQIVAPTEQGLRRDDPTGNGTFGARRAHGSRAHRGTDWLASLGTPVMAPVGGTVTRIGFAYSDNSRLRYVEIDSNEGCSVRVFYVDPNVVAGDQVQQGDTIGTAQDIASFHGAPMKNHVHVEVRCGDAFVDPEAVLAQHN